jgi:hypothetical protein
MKNLLIYINPEKKFDKETELLAKIQIENSLELGWKREDIMIVTNFDYEYNGVKSIVVEDSTYCDVRPHSTKTTTIHYLFEHGMLGEELYWVHDFDAFQSVPIAESEFNLDGVDMALSDYGRMPRWSTGSIVFDKKAKDIFKMSTELIYRRHIDEERSLVRLTENEDIKSRIRKLNISYNFQTNDLSMVYPISTKPIRVLHFHPFKNKTLGVNTLDFFLRGKNKLNVTLASERLIELFKKYGIE